MAAPASGLRNLGPKSREWLAGIGIKTVDELTRVGAVPAYLALKRANGRVSLNLLYALVGAVEGLHWVDVKRQRRLELLMQLDQAEPSRAAASARVRRGRD